MAKDPRRTPLILDLEETDLGAAPPPGEAPPVPEPGEAEEAAAERMLHSAGSGGVWGLGRTALTLAGAVAILALGLAADAFVSALFARAAALGWVGVLLLAALILVLAAAALREVAALARIRKIEGIRETAAAAAESGARPAALEAVAQLAALYAARPELAARRTRLEEAGAELTDGTDLLAMAERELLGPLDVEASRAAVQAARTVAATTALLPMPLVDLAVVLGANLRMIRRIAELYGGRAGWLGSWRLLKAVAGHLAATGAISATDDLLGPMVGGGVLGRLSRRFGEAAVNAGLTARVGVAAIQVCRPLPFADRPAPRARNLLLEAIGGWQGTRAD